MVTLEENELTTEVVDDTAVDDNSFVVEDEDVESKVASLRESLSHDEIPEDLKEFITSLQAAKNDSVEDEILDEESEADEEEMLEDEEEEEEMEEESVDRMSAMEESDSSLDELNDLF